MASEISAQCPEGQQPLQLAADVGKARFICVTDSAVPDKESTSGYSGEADVKEQCPCWIPFDPRSKEVFFCSMVIVDCASCHRVTSRAVDKYIALEN
jgi:hypothetical protein